MNLIAGIRPALPHTLLPRSIAVVSLLCVSEWAIATLLANQPAIAGTVARILITSTLLIYVSGLFIRRHQRENLYLAAMLAHEQSTSAKQQEQLQEREETERALSDQLQFLQILIDSIPAPIFYKDAEGIYTGCNRAFEVFLGRHRDEIVGHSVYGVSPSPQARVYHEKDIELMHRRGQQVYESSVAYADGTLHDVIFNKAAYELADGRLGGLIGVILDITERKNLERELVEAKERAEFFSRSKTQFLTNMSHEIRTPLNAIVGFSQVLLNRSQNHPMPEDFRAFLEKIAISGRGLAELINDVLDISRIEAGKIEAVDEDFNLSGLIKCILVSCEPQAVRKQIKFRCDIDPLLPRCIRMDRGKLSQILINLLGNAIKFSHEQAVIDLRLQRIREDALSIEVVDRGIGIPTEQQPLIFEPFEQVDKSPDGQSRGTGLGLPITRSLVQLLCGEITLESDEGAGSTFRVTLPLHKANSDSQLPADSCEIFHELKGVRILIFEDNAVNQTLMQAFCNDLGIVATFVADGRMGIERAQEIRPDLIFMDVQLPGLSGIEATEKIRQIPEIRNIPIIGLSAAAFQEQRAAGLRAGMNDYLAKPISFPQLISTIKKHL